MASMRGGCVVLTTKSRITQALLSGRFFNKTNKDRRLRHQTRGICSGMLIAKTKPGIKKGFI
jgi:hypothetical protein